MSLSSAKNYALRAERSQDAKEAADLLAKAILELAAAIEATDAKVKKMNKWASVAVRRAAIPCAYDVHGHAASVSTTTSMTNAWCSILHSGG